MAVPIVFGFEVLDGFVGITRHEVQLEETLTLIAEQHFADVTADQIFQANRNVLTDVDRIHPGQHLRIPASLWPIDPPIRKESPCPPPSTTATLISVVSPTPGQL